MESLYQFVYCKTPTSKAFQMFVRYNSLIHTWKESLDSSRDGGDFPFWAGIDEVALIAGMFEQHNLNRVLMIIHGRPYIYEGVEAIRAVEAPRQVSTFEGRSFLPTTLPIPHFFTPTNPQPDPRYNIPLPQPDIHYAYLTKSVFESLL